MSPATRVSDRVSEHLLRICSRNSARAAIPLILAIFLTSLLLSNKVDNRLLFIWVLASSAAILTRVVLLRVVSRHPRLEAFQKRSIATVLNFTLGCIMGSVLYFFPDVGTFERAMLTAILLGLCTVSPSTNFGYRPLLLSYIGPLLGTLAILWIANLDQLLHPALAIAVGISVLIVAQTMLTNGQVMFEAFALSIESSIALEEQSLHLSRALHVAEQAQIEAEASSQSKTRFIAAASHDLRQPVHVLNLLGATLAKASLDPRSQDIVESMNIAVTSLSMQLNALLDMSELDSGAIKPAIQSIDLCTLVCDLNVEMKQLANDKRIQLICDVPEGLIVRTDPVMLAQIVRNLCGNSIKYTFSGHVRIHAHAADTQVILSISDTGIGIGEAEQSKVFEEFYQVSNPGRDKKRGTGLGLCIVERLIRSLSHTIKLSSKVGEGTEVTINLERCTRNQEQGMSQKPARASKDSGLQPVITLPKGCWVHIVDDEDAVQRSAEMFLQTAGCKVTVTASSRITIDFLQENHPDALLIDLRLQDNDSGLHVVDWMYQQRPDIPIALVTGESLSEGDLLSHYPDLLMLQKPVSNDALLELLAYMLSSEEGEQERQAVEAVRET